MNRFNRARCSASLAELCVHKLQNVIDGTATVSFVDYGSHEQIPLSQVCDLSDQPKEVKEGPQLCIPCRLDACVPVSGTWSNRVQQMFTEFALTSTKLSCTFVRKDGDMHDVILRQDGQNIAQKLIADGEAKETRKVSKSESNCDLFRLPAQKITLGSTTAVILSHSADGPKRFSAQTTENILALEEMCDYFIKPARNKLKNSAVGTFCMVHFDDEWFRAKILEVRQPDKLPFSLLLSIAQEAFRKDYIQLRNSCEAKLVQHVTDNRNLTAALIAKLRSEAQKYEMSRLSDACEEWMKSDEKTLHKRRSIKRKRIDDA